MLASKLGGLVREVCGVVKHHPWTREGVPIDEAKNFKVLIKPMPNDLKGVGY